jgi:hypothetical protein
MNSKVITVVLIVVFSCFAFAADKPSKTVILRPGDNSISQAGDGDFMAIPYFSKSFSEPSQLYKVPENLFWIDHTDGELDWQLIGLQAGDTLAVWYKGAGACSLYSIQTQWGSGDDVSTVLFYVWEDAGHPQVGDPGLSFNRNEWEGGSPLGDVVAGPIPFTPTQGQQWQEILLEDFVVDGVPFFGDTEGNPGSFFVGYVLQGEFPEILADDIPAGLNYSWLGGPSVFDADRGIVEWGRFASVIEYMFRVGVTYPFGAKPVITGIKTLPETYQGDQMFEVSATIVDDGTITDAWLHWNINDIVPGEDSVAMTADGDLYTGMFNPMATLGDVVYYWVSATDDEDSTSMESLLNPNNFGVIAPENPNAEILLILDDPFTDWMFPGPTWEFILDSMGYTYEVWDINAMNGIDMYTTNAGWQDGILFAGWSSGVIPTRGWDSEKDPFATFLNNGGSLFHTDMDYFLGNGEGATPTFVSGDFAFDFYGMSGGSNDPIDPADGALDTTIIGAVGDEISDFMSADFVPMRPDDWLDGTNWTDYIVVDQGDFIATSVTGEDVGVKYAAETFKTVYYAFPIEAMNNPAGWTDTTNGEWDSNFWMLVENSFSWLGFEPSATAIDGDNSITVERYSLEQNYPNPFNPSTDITFKLGKAVDVDLAVYSLTGQKVRTLVKGYQKAGEHAVTWNGMNDVGQKVASGVYFYSIEAGDFKSIKKMVLIK